MGESKEKAVNIARGKYCQATRYAFPCPPLFPLKFYTLSHPNRTSLGTPFHYYELREVYYYAIKYE